MNEQESAAENAERADGETQNDIVAQDGNAAQGECVRTDEETESERAAAENAPAEQTKTFGAYVKAFVRKYFITAFSGMALGLFCTLIAGTIVKQIGVMIGTNKAGLIFTNVGAAVQTVMGAGIGVGIAHAFRAKKLSMFSAAAAGMVGANITNIFVASGIKVWGASGTAGSFAVAIGDPVAAYVAVVVALRLCDLIEGKTPVDIILIPLVSILSGLAAAIVLGIPFGMLFALLGRGISHAIEWEPVSFGILIAVVMGLLLTFPTSSAAFGVMLFKPLIGTSLQGASELAAAAACAGCCAHMVGFAVASFRENKWGGLVSQGIGTSMLQIPNLAKNMRILIPAIAASIVAGPLTSALFGLHCDFSGSGMGTAGLVGVFQTVTVSHQAGLAAWRIALGVGVCYFIVPALVALGVSELMRKYKWIRYGDMLLPK